MLDDYGVFFFLNHSPSHVHEWVMLKCTIMFSAYVFFYMLPFSNLLILTDANSHNGKVLYKLQHTFFCMLNFLLIFLIKRCFLYAHLIPIDVMLYLILKQCVNGNRKFNG
jgi:hypothetical protein